jgi:hypothetical protein
MEPACDPVVSSKRSGGNAVLAFLTTLAGAEGWIYFRLAGRDRDAGEASSERKAIPADLHSKMR